MSRQFDNSDDIIDSRDIIERIEELESEMEDYQTEYCLCSLDPTEMYSKEEYDKWDKTHKRKTVEKCIEIWDKWEGLEEYKTLLDVTEQGEGCGDWKYGESLIRDSYFREYAEELAYDLGLVSRNARWPFDCIDWERAAEDLKMDYTKIDFDGVTYWMRS